jgi:hypothetical protein
MRLEGWGGPDFGASWFETRFALLTMRIKGLTAVDRRPFRDPINPLLTMIARIYRFARAFNVRVKRLR